MTNLNELVRATSKPGGGRTPHMEVFMEHISAEHAHELRLLASNPMMNAAHFARVVVALMEQDYEDFPLGLSESGIRNWRDVNG